MATYLVSYDLRTPGKDYASLHQHLKSYHNWAKPLESVWLLKNDAGIEAVRNAIKSHMDNNDKLLVVDVTGRPTAWTHSTFPENISNWIKSFL